MLKKSSLFLLLLIIALCLPGQVNPARAQQPETAPGQFAFFTANNDLWLVQGDLKNPLFPLANQHPMVMSSDQIFRRPDCFVFLLEKRLLM